MTGRKFTVAFALAILSVVGCMWLFSLRRDTAPYIDIGWYAAGVFSVLSIVVYVISDKLSETKRKTLLIQIILMNMLLKMMISAVIVFMYYQLARPADGVFILPFLVVYVIFTVFETYFMNVQATAR